MVVELEIILLGVKSCLSGKLLKYLYGNFLGPSVCFLYLREAFGCLGSRNLNEARRLAAAGSLHCCALNGRVRLRIRILALGFVGFKVQRCLGLGD